MVVLLAPLGAIRATAQDDPDQMPLGDVARNLRKKTPPAKPVIDDDNLPQVMQQADSHHRVDSGLRFLMSGDSRGFQVSAPDVTCSLAFTANVKTLLSSQYGQMDLPPGEMAKIEGKAVVEGDALSVPVFNGTQWHLSELAVAFTVVKKARTGVVPWNQDGASSASADSDTAVNTGDGSRRFSAGSSREEARRHSDLPDEGCGAAVVQCGLQRAAESGTRSRGRMALGHCAGQGLSAGDIRQQRETACDRTCEAGVHSVRCVPKGGRSQEGERDLRRT